MIEVIGNLWTYPADFRVITTNGSVRRDGLAVMGRGCAKEATNRYPEIARDLGHAISTGGNHVWFFSHLGWFSFPVKHAWDDRADLKLIARSVEEFTALTDPTATYVMPRPGCGNGRLVWAEVKPLLLGLSDNVKVIDFGTVAGKPPRAIGKLKAR